MGTLTSQAEIGVWVQAPAGWGGGVLQVSGSGLLQKRPLP